MSSANTGQRAEVYSNNKQQTHESVNTPATGEIHLTCSLDKFFVFSFYKSKYWHNNSEAKQQKHSIRKPKQPVGRRLSSLPPRELSAQHRRHRLAEPPPAQVTPTRQLGGEREELDKMWFTPRTLNWGGGDGRDEPPGSPHLAAAAATTTTTTTTTTTYDPSFSYARTSGRVRDSAADTGGS